MKVFIKKKYIWLVLIGACILTAICILLNKKDKSDSKTVVTIAVLQDDLVQNFNTNYYTNWLEEKTGYDIEFEYISDNYELEYLNSMLSAKDGRVDAVFLPYDNSILSAEQFEEYINSGLIYDIRLFQAGMYGQKVVLQNSVIELQQPMYLQLQMWRQVLQLSGQRMVQQLAIMYIEA